MNKKAIHMQLYPPHFGFGSNLIKGFSDHCADFKEFNFYVFVDTEEDVIKFNTLLQKKIETENVKCISLENVLNSNFDYICNRENYHKAHKNIKEGIALFDKWGTAISHSRTWMGIKRTYGILELHKRGYNRVWCVDAESYPLKDFNIQEMFSSCDKKYILSISENGAWNSANIATKVLQQDKDSILNKIGVRINDFWIIDTNLFQKMIQEISELHQQPVSYFVRGCEQALYEIWLYQKHLNKEIDIECITFSNKDFENIIDDMPHFNTATYCYIHFLLSYVVDTNSVDNFLINRNRFKNKNINLEAFAERINKIYFDKIQCYRGDMIKLLSQNERGKYLLSLLNIKFAVSNWQGH